MTTRLPKPMVAAPIWLALAGFPISAGAQPVPFPDLGSLTPVNVADYSIATDSPGRGSSSRVYFLTPDGNACVIDPASAVCTGNNFPGVPPASSGPLVTNRIGTDVPLQHTGGPIGQAHNAIQGQPIRPLPPQHSITVGTTICGVDGTGTTACKDSAGRAFEISAQGAFSLQQ